MAYSLQALKDLIQNSPSIKDMPEELQKKVLKMVKGSQIGEKRRLYYVLLQEKVEMEKVNDKFNTLIEKSFNQYESTVKHLSKKI